MLKYTKNKEKLRCLWLERTQSLFKHKRFKDWRSANLSWAQKNRFKVYKQMTRSIYIYQYISLNSFYWTYSGRDWRELKLFVCIEVRVFPLHNCFLSRARSTDEGRAVLLLLRVTSNQNSESSLIWPIWICVGASVEVRALSRNLSLSMQI